jgi:spoIIIJ-associated protein
VNKIVEATGRNVEEAVKNALNELNISRDKVDVEVLDGGTKGLFGLLGSKLSKVRVTVKNDYGFAAKDFLRQVLENMGIKAEIQVQESKDALKIDLKGPSMGILIGHRGETLDSLQYLVSLVVNKDNQNYKKIMLDTEDYRKKREETLIKLAKRLAQKTKKTGSRTVLEPMNPYERRILHATLQHDPSIETHSEGEEPFRRVVIDLKRN